MTARTRRLMVTFSAMMILGLAVFLVLSALEDNIVYFYSPSELETSHQSAKRLRIGGLVKDGSAKIDGLTAEFILTDGADDVSVSYKGALPDLFREGQGIIAEGAFQNNYFIADIVLAKHDETYMPREVADSLKEKGLWQGNIAADGVVR